MKRTLAQNKRLHQLLGELNIGKEQKEELIYLYTNERTTSSSEMIVPECQALINFLNAQTKKESYQPEDSPSNKMRRKILSICHEMRWTKDGKIDWPRLNAFMLKSSYLKKELNEYTYTELPKLVSQFESLLTSHYARG